MGFDVELAWDTLASDSTARNRQLADALLTAVDGMSELPLDPVAIAGVLQMPVADIGMHWSQIVLLLPPGFIASHLELWHDRAYLGLPSNPPCGCEAALAALQPILRLLAERGLRVQEPEPLLAEYELQRARVLRVAEIVGGQASP